MEREISVEKLDKYFDVTGRALEKARNALNENELEHAKDFLDMASRYYADAGFFRSKDDFVLAFGALNYAHGWLDAGARIKLFLVNDSTLFTVDEDEF